MDFQLSEMGGLSRPRKAKVHDREPFGAIPEHMIAT